MVGLIRATTVQQSWFWYQHFTRFLLQSNTLSHCACVCVSAQKRNLFPFVTWRANCDVCRCARVLVYRIDILIFICRCVVNNVNIKLKSKLMFFITHNSIVLLFITLGQYPVCCFCFWFQCYILLAILHSFVIFSHKSMRTKTYIYVFVWCTYTKTKSHAKIVRSSFADSLHVLISFVNIINFRVQI